MKRTLSVLVSAAALILANPGPVAAGAVHDFWAEDYKDSEHFDAGQGPCVPWSGTFHEVRTGGYRVVVAPGGQQEGEFHVNGVIAGSVELIPDDRALPTYAGTYREKVNAVATEWTQEGVTSRIAQYRLRSTLQGTDGSTLHLLLSGKLTTNANGVVAVERDAFACE